MKSIFKNTFLVTIAKLSLVSILPKLLGFLKEVLIAQKFGVSAEVDSYILYLAFITFPLAFYINGIQIYLTREIKHNRQDTEKLLFTAIKICLLSFVVIVPLYLYFGLNQISQDSTSLLIVACLSIYYLITSLNLILYGFLQAIDLLRQNFVTPVINHLLFISVIFLLPFKSLETLLISLLVGTISEFVVMVFTVRKHISGSLINLKNYKRLISIKPVKLIFTFSLVSVIPGLIPLVEQIIYSKYGPGVISMIAYSSKIPVAISGLFLSVISVYSFTYFEKYSPSIIELRKNAILIFFGFSVMATILALLSPNIVDFFYKSDKIDSYQLSLISTYQKIYIFQIPFLAVNMLFWRLILFILPQKRILKTALISGLLHVILITVTQILALDIIKFLYLNLLGSSLLNFIIYQYTATRR